MYLKFWIKLTALVRNRRLSISFRWLRINRNTYRKKVQLTLIRSRLHAFQWAKDEHRTLSVSPERVARKRKVSEIWTISCDNSETVQDRMSVTINH